MTRQGFRPGAADVLSELDDINRNRQFFLEDSVEMEVNGWFKTFPWCQVMLAH